jgi:geranylgeranyl diphosphate synthase, type I
MSEITGFNNFSEEARPALRKELERAIAPSAENGTPALREMITYQLGWSGENAGPKAEGKQIRPLLVLIACQAGGGDWKNALPAAAAVELIHNFSLIHDDIEDNSEIRRGRPTVWKVWGEAQAINTGDAIFALAYASLLNLVETTSPEIGLQAGKIFHQTCLRLTQGQHLDIAFEDQKTVELESYWQMVGGKTAALLAFSLEAGALIAGVTPEIQNHYRDFGHYLGMSFQVQDDILGIWGAEEQLGKSITGDLVTRKKTLPVLFGLAQEKGFYKGWNAGEITPENALVLSQILEAEGGRAYAQSTADRLTDLALTALEKADPEGEAGEILRELAKKMLKRQD